MKNLTLINGNRSETPEDDEPEVITSEEYRKKNELTAGLNLNFLDYSDLATSQEDKPYIVPLNQPNPLALNLQEREAIRPIRDIAKLAGKKLSASDISAERAELSLCCELDAPKMNIFRRNAPLPDGVEIDNVGENGARWSVTASGVSEVKAGGVNIFHRPSYQLPLPTPAEKGDLKLLMPFLNMDHADKHLLVVLMIFTLANPKVPTTTYLELFTFGGKGSGKSFLARAILKPLVDPSIQSLQAFPGKLDDLTIAISGSLMSVFDNVRKITDPQSDHLCRACSHAFDAKRSLYTNAQQHIQLLHGFVCITGIDSSLISQPDLIERSLAIELKKIPSDRRKSEQDMEAELNAVKSQIFRGMLDTMSEIFAALPYVTVDNPARMIDFQRYIAAYELVTEMPDGVLQAHYLDSLNRQMSDGILDDIVSRAIHDFINYRETFTGTSTALLAQLNDFADKDVTSSKYWPQTPVALGRRLKTIAPKLETAGIILEFTRGKERLISISVIV